MSTAKYNGLEVRGLQVSLHKGKWAISVAEAISMQGETIEDEVREAETGSGWLYRL